jgi:hypothetical protein
LVLLRKLLSGTVGFITGLLATALTFPYLYYLLARAQVLEQGWSWPKSLAASLTLGQIGIAAGSLPILLRALAFPFEGFFAGFSKGFRAAFRFPLDLHEEYKNYMLSGRYQTQISPSNEGDEDRSAEAAPRLDEEEPIQAQNQRLLTEIESLPLLPKPLTKQELETFEQALLEQPASSRKEALQKKLEAYRLYLSENACVVSATDLKDLEDPITVKQGSTEHTYSEASLKQHIRTCSTTFKRLADDPLTRAPLTNKAAVSLHRGLASCWQSFIAEVRKLLNQWSQKEEPQPVLPAPSPRLFGKKQPNVLRREAEEATQQIEKERSETCRHGNG